MPAANHSLLGKVERPLTQAPATVAREGGVLDVLRVSLSAAKHVSVNRALGPSVSRARVFLSNGPDA